MTIPTIRKTPSALTRPVSARTPSARSRVRQVAADVADVEAARDGARAVGDVEVDAGDEAGARPRPDRDVRAQLQALAVVGDRVLVGLAAARELADVALPREPEVAGGLAERAAEAVGVGVHRGELVQAPERLEDVGRATIRAVGGRLVRGLGEDEVHGAVLGA